MGAWSTFFQGELGAAAALAGLLFVSVSVNHARILELGRMADRGLEALAMLFLVIVIASLGLIPGQPTRLFGIEALAAGTVAFVALLPLQRDYLRQTEAAHRANSLRMVMFSRGALAVIVLAGAVLAARGDEMGLYILPAGVLAVFLAVGLNAWVLLIEINR